MKRKTILFYLIFSVSLLSVLSCSEQKNRVVIEDTFYPLPAGAVQLDGFFEEYIQNSIQHWNMGELPYDQFADFFRNGRPQFALGEMWGKAVRSGCMFYRYTNDPQLKQIMDETVSDLLTTQRENGSISCVEIDKQPEESELWERKYVMLGLEEYYEWVNPDPRVLDALIKQADNIISIIGPAPKTEIVDVGWSATNIGHEPCHIESSTLLEPFMRLYKWTGEKRFLDFATYIIASGGTKQHNVFENALNNVNPWEMAGHYPKAYEMMSLFEGLVEYYRVKGDPQHKEMLLNMFKNISTKEITIIGNGGSDQPYHPYVYGEAWGNTALEQTNPDITRMMETCVGVTWIKLCSQLLRLTGDPSIADYIEKYAYNGLIGAMKPTGDGFSYVNLLNGSKVTDEGWGWKFDSLQVTCCNLNGPMGLAYIPYVAVMNAENGPVINLYNRDTAVFETPKRRSGTIDIDTDFPLTGNIQFNLTLEKEEAFTIRFRIPGWSEKTVMTVNDEEVMVTPGTYAEINREWKQGDRVSLSLDMRCRIIDAPQGSNRAGDNFQAVAYGPVVLARDENLESNYNDPVVLQAENGYIRAKQEDPQADNINLQFSVPVEEGKYITMIDYASVDNWNNGKHVCTWLPIKH
ncbi:MAG: glycoside hydrolase family 127 protein [Proteiniphilum sp.]|nr:glycoside hydrolase family 127 protein [Proteiniphilum sp.]